MDSRRFEVVGRLAMAIVCICDKFCAEHARYQSIAVGITSIHPPRMNTDVIARAESEIGTSRHLCHYQQ